MKKPWREPQLIALVRGAVEESVLVTCRTGGGTASPEAPGFLPCVCVDGGLKQCATCQLLVQS